MKKVLKITAIVAAALFLTVYGVGCWYFYTHYFYGTKIDGVIYGCMTPEEVAADVIARQQNYSLTIQGRYEMEEVRTGKELGASIDPLEELKADGINVIEVDDITPWQEACKDIINESTKDNAELYQQILDMK